ncbi:MAG: hypothetical protein ABSE92_18030 [Terriglobales bacterium]
MTESKTPTRPIASISLIPKTDSDRVRILRALDEMAGDDQTIRIEADPDGGVIGVKGMGELHLEIIRDRLSHEHKFQFDFSGPEAIYLETIRRVAEAEGKYVRVASRIHLYGHAKLRLVPLDRGTGYEFINEVPDDVLPPQSVQAVNFGVQEAMRGGILVGNELVDLRAVLCGGSWHAEGSNEMAFKIAGSLAFKEAARKASPLLLEPMMAIKVEVPEEYAGTVMGDLSSRRALIKGMEGRADSVIIAAEVPLAEMFGYPDRLRMATSGWGNYTLDFSHYEECPWREDSGGDEIRVTAN